MFGKGLLPIRGGLLVGRYNDCLKAIGLAPTSLERFSIDAMGWSPEIADEKKDNFYLSHGLANTYAILVSLDQKGLPVYFPVHSFDRRMMEKIFTDAEAQISDLLTEGGIWVEMDENIEHYESPEDLMMIDAYELRIRSTVNLPEAKREQAALIRQYYEEDRAWSDTALRSEIIRTSKEHGDLRFRQFDVPAIPFLEVQSFFTQAFGGVFVLRNVSDMDPLIVHASETAHNEQKVTPSGYRSYAISDPHLWSYLEEHGVYDIYMDELATEEGVSRLQRIKDLLLLEAIVDSADETADLSYFEGPKRKMVVKRLSDLGLLKKTYFTADRLLRKIKRLEDTSTTRILKKERELLIRPNPEFPQNLRKLLWQMMMRRTSFDILRMYAHDRSEFFAHYQKWAKIKQEWAVAHLKKHYLPTYIDRKDASSQ